MATPATLWATDAGAGDNSGDSLINAAVVDPSDVNDVWSIVNGYGALTQALDIRLCGNASTTAACNITKDALNTFRITIQGRNAGDTADSEATIDAGGGAYDVFEFTTADFWIVQDIHATNTDKVASNHGFYATSSADHMFFNRCRASECNAGFQVSAASNPRFLRCTAHNNGLYGIFSAQSGSCAYCSTWDNPLGQGFLYGSFFRCNSHNDRYGFNSAVSVTECSVYSPTYDAFKNDGSATMTCTDCIASVCGRSGYRTNTAVNMMILKRCAHYLCTSGRSNSATGTWVDEDPITLTADPFLDIAGSDFTLNNDAGGGALLRGVEFTFPDAVTKSYHDIGGAQHKDRVIVTV